MIRRAVEALVVGAAGSAIAGTAAATVGVASAGVVVGGCNGLISGWRRIYDWRCSTGLAAFVLDSSWALPSTAGAQVTHLIAAATGAHHVADMSIRRNRHVYARGFTPRRGFAVTIGNTISGAGDTATERRRHLVDHHEEVHVWQARLLGPIFPVAYLGWIGIAAPLGALAWLRGRRAGDQSTTLWSAVDRFAYWNNPFERQAYLRASQATRAVPD